MERQPVSSSMMRSVGYDPTSETLEVEFNSGAVWQYREVPQEVYEQLISSDSLGSYFRQLIKDQYPERRVT